MAQRHLATFNSFKCRIDSIISSAKHFHPTMKQLSDNFNKVLSDEKFKKLPIYMREELINYHCLKRSMMLQEYTILLTVGQDGRVFVNKWDNLTEQEKDHIRNGGKLQSHFYWLNKTEKRDISGRIEVVYTPSEKIYFTPSL